MAFNLRNFVLAPAVLAAAALTTNTAMAEATLTVPFNFTVAGKNCPAGLYTVQRDHGLVILTSRAAQQSFVWPLSPGDPAPTASNVSLTFDQLGQDHALRSIQYGPMVTFRLDKPTKENEHAPRVVLQGQ